MNDYKDPTTIGEINARLIDLGIQKRLTPVSLEHLFAGATTENTAGRQRVMHALRLAANANTPGSLNAVSFLTKQVESAVTKARETDRSPVASRAQSQPDNVTPFDRNARQPIAAVDDDVANAPDEDEAPSRGARQSTNGQEQESVVRMQVKAFGRKAAFCAESDVTRRGVPTVRFELATAIGEKQFDWTNKLAIQLTQDEIIEAAAVLFGFAPQVEFKNHGDQGKWLSIENQGNTMCIRGGATQQANSLRLVPIGIGRTTALAALLVAQLDKSLFGAGSNGTLLALLGRVAGTMMTSAPKRSANR